MAQTLLHESATTQKQSKTEAWGTFTHRIILDEKFDWSWPSSTSMCECCWCISWSCTHACRVRHGFGRGLSLKLTSLFTRRSATEEVRADGLLEENSGYHALLVLVFLHVIINQRQWGVILINEQCLPKKKSICVICVKELHERHHRMSVPARWVCRQTVDSLSQLIGHWSHGTGICMDLHVLSTDPSTLCRNAGGNKLWWFILLGSVTDKYSVVQKSETICENAYINVTCFLVSYFINKIIWVKDEFKKNHFKMSLFCFNGSRAAWTPEVCVSDDHDFHRSKEHLELHWK